jgi:hypothetical protein
VYEVGWDLKGLKVGNQVLFGEDGDQGEVGENGEEDTVEDENAGELLGS